MKTHTLLQCIVVSAALTLSGCSSNDDDKDNPETQSEFNENAPDDVNTGEPGGDISAIAGLWDGSTTAGDITDVVYWNLADDGVLTRYDYQQDGVASASGQNCYVIGDPITVTPESNDSYSIFNVAVTAVRNDDALTITFLDADKNDVDLNGDTTEVPTFNWTLLTTPVLQDLNDCTSADTESSADSGELTIGPDPGETQEDTQTQLPGSEDEDIGAADPVLGDGTGNDDRFPPIRAFPVESLTRSQCEEEGGTVVGDIGNGAIFEPEYRCESGNKPIGRVIAIDGEPIATDGEVCCI